VAGSISKEDLGQVLVAEAAVIILFKNKFATLLARVNSERRDEA
jgi:hypothetical protein